MFEYVYFSYISLLSIALAAVTGLLLYWRSIALELAYEQPRSRSLSAHELPCQYIFFFVETCLLTAHDTDIYVIMSIQCFINVGHSLVANQCPKSICLKSIKLPLQLRLCHLHCPSTLGLRKRKYRMITGFAQVHVQNRVAEDSMKMHTRTYIL